MVLNDPVVAVSAAATVFFILLGVFYLFDLTLPPRTWFGIVFVLVGLTILLILVSQAGIGGLLIAIIAALVAKGELQRRGIGK